ncbi:hypothetical protein R3I93_012974 [Phoxinus phoxinus]|uniref:Uncharacterized protein n=1 Tax=Phoxinus phoxinus TaxID=58324 RepID=A0AAN9H279_9TELE
MTYFCGKINLFAASPLLPTCIEELAGNSLIPITAKNTHIRLADTRRHNSTGLFKYYSLRGWLSVEHLHLSLAYSKLHSRRIAVTSTLASLHRFFSASPVTTFIETATATRPLLAELQPQEHGSKCRALANSSLESPRSAQGHEPRAWDYDFCG